ncbi:MAG: hypothetical protein PHV02_05000 [Rhodocyclaceae bacterium]|nr:hypothetical protein [Rhodocyclaceae bacterium]
MNDSRHLNVIRDAHVSDTGNSSNLPEEWCESLAGEKFNLNADRWQLTTKKSLNVGPLRSLLHSPTLRDSGIRTLAHLAKTKSVDQCINTSLQMRHLLRFWDTPLGDEIPVAAITSFRHHSRESDGHDAKVSGRIRPFLTKWHELGYPGVSKELIEQMADWTLKNQERGARANRLDPNEGPLMPDEALSFKALALSAFEKGSIPLADYASFRLASLGYRRPEQIVSLKCKDMDDSRLETREPNRLPERMLLLMVPRVKGGRSWRKHFRSIPLSVDLWNLLALHRTEVIRRFDELLASLALKLQQQELKFIHDELALFPAWMLIKKSLQTLAMLIDDGKYGEAVNHLRDLVVSRTWHAETIVGIRDPLARIVAATHAINRNNEPLKVFQTRFRYTANFEMERQGCPPPVRAWNLDHETTDSLISYHTNGPDAAARLSKATANGMSKYVRMFQGKVVDRESDAEGGSDPDASRLFIHGMHEGATCSVKRGCGMTTIPRCCYAGCAHFQPWVDGPHEALLDELLEERELLLKSLRPLEDRKIIEANDGLILGVAQVIWLCESRRQELIAEAKQADGKKHHKGARK